MSTGINKSEVLNRIKQFYKIKTNSELARFFDVAPSTISNWYCRDSFDIDLIIAKCKGVSLEWLLTGEGFEIITNHIKENELAYISKKEKKIPFYDITDNTPDFKLGMSPEYIKMINPGDFLRDATAAMRIYGNSMEPDYKSGAIIAIKEVKNIKLVLFGQDYVIETSEYRILKRIQQTEDKLQWLACSCNNSVWDNGSLKGKLIYEPFPINIKDIKRLFIVIGCFTRVAN